MTEPYTHKLDVTLQRLVGAKDCAVTDLVDCLIVLSDWADQQEVAALIEAQGGIIHRHLTVVIVASIPVSALSVIASSEHVMQVEAEGTKQPRLFEALKAARTAPADLTVVLTELDDIRRAAEAEVERLYADSEAFDGMGNHSDPDYHKWVKLAAELGSLTERLRR